MKNYKTRLEKLEEVINVYQGKPTIFVVGDDLQEQVEEHNKVTGEKLIVGEVMKWKKVKMGGGEWLLSPGWIFEDWLGKQKENFYAK